MAIASRPPGAADPDGGQHEGIARDRLQPVLLDRLTDHQPASRQERAGAFLMSGRLLRAAVLRDLQWLFNTTGLEADHPIHRLPRAQRSVVNYGLRAWAGARVSEINFADVEAAIRVAIVQFEPRIMKDSIEVRCVTESGDLEHHNQLALEIRGTLWSVPYPVEFILRSELDLESGHVALRSIGGL